MRLMGAPCTALPSAACALLSHWQHRCSSTATHSVTEEESLLVVHPRQQPRHVLEEALRLAETYTGERCHHFSVGCAAGDRGLSLPWPPLSVPSPDPASCVLAGCSAAQPCAPAPTVSRPAKRVRPSPATYFGSGVVEAVAHRTQMLGATR